MCLPLKPFRIEREWEHAGLVQAREAFHRCGYVRVPPRHPLHGKDCDHADVQVNVHGGLTFAQMEPCAHEDGTGWWFGFDCCHAGDAMYDPYPDLATLSAEAKAVLASMNRIHREVSLQVYGKLTSRHEHFWTQFEVERECEDLAEQLAEVRHALSSD